MSDRKPYLGKRAAQKGRTPYLGERHANTTRTPYLGDTSKSGTVTVETPKKKGHGGILGTLKRGAHFTASKAGLAAHDIKQIPGGLVDLATPAVHEAKATGYLAVGNVKGARREAEKAHKQSAALVKGTKDSTVESFRHPLRDPFITALNASTVVSGGVGALARAGAVAKTGRVGAALEKPAVVPRLLKIGEEQVPLHASKNPAVRGAQAVYDKTLQHAIDRNPEGRVAAHATKRAGGSADETARYRQRMREVPGQLLAKSAKKLAPTGGRLPGSKAARLQRVEQAALELVSVNTPAEKAAAYHAAQAEKGVAPARNTALAKLYATVHERGLLTTDEHGNVVVNAAEHPHLATADKALARVQGLGDETLAKHGVRTPEQLAERVNAPGRVRAGASYEKPTPGKRGVPSQALVAAHARVARLEGLFERSQIKHDDVLPNYLGGKGPSPITTRLGGALSVAKDELQRLEAAAEKRVTPTGLQGGENARPGRGFVSYATEEPRAPKNAAAASTAPVVGVAKTPITSKTFTGQGIEHGKVPNDITGQAVRHFHQIVRFVNTTERRNQAIRAGSPVRRTSRDVLVRVPGAEHAKIPAEVEQILGRKKLTHDDVEGLSAALNAYREDLVPGLRDRFSADKQVGIGVAAPEGHVWVDRNVLGELARPAAIPRGRVARFADSVNAAVTAATVYFKIGHVGTRVLTNAATNIIQGSAAPAEIGRSVTLWKQLSHEDRLRSLAAAGQHGFEAMPHEGQNVFGRVATHGALWWAKHADAPFRFNSIAYEARVAGFKTPEQFRYMLDKLENPEGLDAAQTAKIDWVAKRSNRAQIAYDRLNEAERRYVTRATWFYPWIKGATMFAGHTLVEHPYKSAVMGNAGALGREQQQRELGDLPSYEAGLFRLGRGGARPTVADFSTFSPFATPAELLDVAAGDKSLAEFLNPALAGANALANKLNIHGGPSKNVPADVIAATAGPTSEYQLAEALLHRRDNQANRMFSKTPGSVLERALIGPGMPRRINLAAAHRAAARERAGTR